jgi:hypothetical protein
MLRGTVVGAKMGPLQYARWLRQSFTRKKVRLTLYEYRRPITRWTDAPVVKTTTTDKRGHFDFGNLQPGHYTLVLEDADWGTSDWYDVEVTRDAPRTVSVTVDISPFFPDCKGGHEFIVETK